MFDVWIHRESEPPCQDEFRCQKCGYENNADYNAAKNIGWKSLRRDQNRSEGGALIGVRLNSGMLNEEGIKPLPRTNG